jgi:hypothetical protein
MNKRGKGSAKIEKTANLTPRTRMTRAMVKRFEEDKRRNEEMSLVIVKPTKRPKVQTSEPKSRSTLELDESQ